MPLGKPAGIVRHTVVMPLCCFFFFLAQERCHSPFQWGNALIPSARTSGRAAKSTTRTLLLMLVIWSFPLINVFCIQAVVYGFITPALQCGYTAPFHHSSFFASIICRDVNDNVAFLIPSLHQPRRFARWRCCDVEPFCPSSTKRCGWR